tara:strand:+ start:220 stop:468 length:249 start_codon:yes stop_codon:yes gene_type:complete
MLDMAKHFLCDSIQVVDDDKNIDMKCVLMDPKQVEENKHILHMNHNGNHYYTCHGIYEYHKGVCELNISLENVVDLPHKLKQ